MEQGDGSRSRDVPQDTDMQYNNFDVRSRGRLRVPDDRWKLLRELEKKVVEARKSTPKRSATAS